VRSESPIYSTSRRRSRKALPTPTVVALVVGGALVLGALLGLAFAGSSRELAAGTQIAGIDVGGLTRRQAIAKLESSFEEVSAVPVEFVAGTETYSLAANQLAVQPDWAAAVAVAGRSADGFGPIRGFRRLRTRIFGAEVLPRLSVSDGALEYALDRIAAGVDAIPRSAALARRGLRVVVVPGRSGAELDRDAAAEAIVRTLGTLERPGLTLQLPVAVVAPQVTAAMLAGPAARARLVLSAPVRLRGANRSFRLPRHRLAELVVLPSDGATRLAIAGPAAEAYFRGLSDRVGRPAEDARFEVSGDKVRVVPSREGVELDVSGTARALLLAATRRANRVADLQLVRSRPDLTTERALAMGIDTRMAGYRTYYSGTADRITNLQLGVRALDGTLVPPGGTFSLNDAIGERTLERGFRPAPVIIGNEYAEEVGGGTSQVATTVFNAAWEAGLRITERHPHSLYISRYQLGRDATVYWPSLDLKFQNDTSSWVLVKGLTEADAIHVLIYGGERRRVESSATPLVVTGGAPRKLVKDPTLEKGKRVVEEEGSRPSRTSATRTIYGPDGKIIRTETWATSYKGETRIVRVGTKEPTAKSKQGKPGVKQKPPAGETTTPPTGSTP
jgi:vancomycin resistance protein YoaR